MTCIASSMTCALAATTAGFPNAWKPAYVTISCTSCFEKILNGWSPPGAPLRTDPSALSNSLLSSLLWFLQAGPSQVLRYHLWRGPLVCRMRFMFRTSKGLAKSRFANVWFVQCSYDWDGRAAMVCYHLAFFGWIVEPALSTVVGRYATVKTNAMPRYYETLCLENVCSHKVSTCGPLW